MIESAGRRNQNKLKYVHKNYTIMFIIHVAANFLVDKLIRICIQCIFQRSWRKIKNAAQDGNE